jgi:hypothetical protein
VLITTGLLHACSGTEHRQHTLMNVRQQAPFCHNPASAVQAAAGVHDATRSTAVTYVEEGLHSQICASRTVCYGIREALVQQRAVNAEVTIACAAAAAVSSLGGCLLSSHCRHRKKQCNLNSYKLRCVLRSIVRAEGSDAYVEVTGCSRAYSHPGTCERESILLCLQLQICSSPERCQ